MKKKIKLTILLLGLFLLVLNFFFWITDIIAGKKGIESLSIIYSNVGNEEWLGFWGNIISGILPLIVIFHYQEESKKQQEQFKQQLKFQEEQQYQTILIEKIKEEEKITKDVLKLWDNSVFDNLFNLIIDYYKQLLYEEDKKIRKRYLSSKKTDEEKYINIQLEFLTNYNREKNKLIAAFNYGMLEIDLLPWRMNNTKENLENNNFKVRVYYNLRKKCYESFKILHDKVSKDFFNFFSAQCNISPTQNKIEIEKNFYEFNKKKEQLLLEYSELYIAGINNISKYFYSCNKFIQTKNFEVFEDRTFLKKENNE